MFPAILLQALIVLLVVGVVLWGADQLPIDATIKSMIRVMVIVLTAIWLIYIVAGMLGVGPYPLVR